jgi:hypothetical protein
MFLFALPNDEASRFIHGQSVPLKVNGQETQLHNRNGVVTYDTDEEQQPFKIAASNQIDADTVQFVCVPFDADVLDEDGLLSY